MVLPSSFSAFSDTVIRILSIFVFIFNIYPDIMTNSDLLQLISITVVISAVIYGVIQGVHYIVNRRQKDREEYLKSFDIVVAQLSSDNKASQLSAAILLRRYFSARQNRRNDDLRTETINVISALLRTVPTGVFQKTLGDGLAYAGDLSGADLQKTNLQNIYLGRKGSHIKMDNRTDFFLADMSYALVENVIGVGAIFYRAVLFNTKIKNCTFTDADFSGADLSNVKFENVILYGANFRGAKNIPAAIAETLDAEGKCSIQKAISTELPGNGKKIFFSMPGTLSKADEVLTLSYKDVLENKGYEVEYYMKDDYPEFGQFTKIKESIIESSAMVVFGFKQVEIERGKYYPKTSNEKDIELKYLPTPWNELETGMGLVRRIPILLVKDPAIESGIFDDKLSECFVSTILTDFDSRNLKDNPAFREWIKLIES